MLLPSIDVTIILVNRIVGMIKRLIHIFFITIVATCLSVGTASAEVYGGDDYGGCEYSRDCAEKEVVGTALIKNMDSWLRPGAIAQYIADKGYFTIVINDGGGTSIAPPGGYDPVLATNPIAYGIPTSREPLVVDMATSKRAWGQVRLANKYGTELPKDTFYNNKGKITLDPKEAHSVLPFGDHKGFALALMIEVLCGSLVGMDSMMLDTNSAGSNFGVPLQDRGGFILVIDPRRSTSLDLFRKKNTELLYKIKATSKLKDETIRIPGEDAGDLQEKRIAEDEIEIPDTLWEELKSL
jgi:L-2-hydroxycarboxylate dehydrogenase (NAD+)